MRFGLRGLAACGAVVFFAVLLSACGKRPSEPSEPRGAGAASTADSVSMWVRYPRAETSLSPRATLGKQIFFDASLSASGKMACASCHDPNHAYGPANDLAVQLGGPDLSRPGTRAVPSLRYLQFTPKFTRHYLVPSSDGAEDEGPAGGFTRDGAVDSLHEQAQLPLLNPLEMANPDAASVTAKLRKTSYAVQFQQLSGPHVFDDPVAALKQATLALEAFQNEDPSFQPYTSKFDAAMSGNASFTTQELRGYTVFNDPNKGNCAKCHLDAPGPGGRPAQFTDFGLVALGVPRNPEISANHDPRYFDLGLCGPMRKDLARETDFCGLFKTPTLRNAASRKVFFHNGRFRTLDEVLHFYAERDSDPAKWYPRRKGEVLEYDDLPTRYRSNVDHVDVPFNRKHGDAPAFSDSEIADLTAFMKTLDDGYSRQAGGTAAK